MCRPAALGLVVLAGCASSPTSTFLYFPQLAARAQSQDPAVLEQVIALSAATPPGERLEELAEIASGYVRAAPATFLYAQAAGRECFGASFLGPAFVDNPQKREEELAGRRRALESVTLAALAAAKARCLAELAGS